MRSLGAGMMRTANGETLPNAREGSLNEIVGKLFSTHSDMWIHALVLPWDAKARTESEMLCLRAQGRTEWNSAEYFGFVVSLYAHVFVVPVGSSWGPASLSFC